MADNSVTTPVSSNPTPQDESTTSATTHQQVLPRMDDEMQRVLALIAARSRGEASNDAVEEAVTHLLQSTGCVPTTTTATVGKPTSPAPNPPPPPSTHQQQPSDESTTKIVADDDNYDDDDDDDDEKEDNVIKDDDKPASRKRPRTSKTPVKTTPSSRRRRTPSKDDNKNNNNNNSQDYDDLLDQIPLGRQGAKMMTTFGDGSHPHPSSVAAALLGARHMLQVAIRDARAIRRRAKQQFDLAKIATMTKKKTSLATHAATAAIDSTMLYRAMEGYDKLAFDIKCGFDMEQLRVLFPEEMNAYAKWNEVSMSHGTEERRMCMVVCVCVRIFDNETI